MNLGSIIQSISLSISRKYFYFLAIQFLVVFSSFSQNNDLAFSSAATYAQVANSAAINPANITVEAWIYPTAWRPNEFEGSIVNKEGGAGGYMLRCGNNGQLSFYVYSGGNWRGGSTATNALSLNTWTHVAGVFNGTNVMIYINGAQVANFTYTGTITSTTTPLEIGRSNLNTSRYFIGKIDEARIWNTALTSAVISSWYNKTITNCHSNYANLVGYYECNNTTSAVLTATVGSNGTVSGATYGASTSPITSVTGFLQTTASQPITSSVSPGNTNKEVLMIEVETFSAMDATQFILRTNGTTNVTDITNAKLWYTGTSNVFSTTTQYGTTTATPPVSGVDMIFNGTQVLACGKNYFWLSYDIAAGATTGNIVDATYQSAIVNATSRTPVTSAPAGSRPIAITCTHTIRITDTASDGWNGGQVKVQVNGVDVLTNVGSTFNTGAGPIDFTFNAGTGNTITVIETAAGSWPSEMRVRILDGGGTVLLGPFDPSSGAGNSTIGNCPSPMTYVSSTTTQNNTSNTLNGSTNQEIIGIQVITTGASSPLSATQFTLNANGTTAISDINGANSAKIYYTGTSGSFATTTLFGQATPTIANYTITGTQSLSPGTNYFWLVYNIQASATVGNVVDAECTSITIGSSQTPTTTSPLGNRPIVTTTYPGGVSTGLQTWLRADEGLTGTTPITNWTNQNTSGTPVIINGSPNLNSTSTSYNYNPYVDFTAPVGIYTPNSSASNRQFLKLSGYDGITGIDYRSLFWTFNTTDLTREFQHIATVDDITHLAPTSTLHGASTTAQSAVHLDSYDVTDFGSSSAAGTWRRNNLNILNDAIHSSSKHVLSAVSSTGGSATLNRFLGGQRDHSSNGFLGSPRDWKGPVAEIIGYTTQLTEIERQKIHSYLGIKYGLTLTQNYLSTSGLTIFATSAPYNNNIIGIGRDDIEGLNQKQSHNDDDVVRIYMGTLASMNAYNTVTFSSNISYVVTGANTGAMCATAAAISEMPTSCSLYSRIEREWKITRTNMGQDFNMDFKLSSCAAPGSVNVVDLHLLVDDDGNFANGGTSCYSNTTNPGLFTYSNPTITVTGITAAMIPNNSTRYITIGSVNIATPLPIELLTFDAQLNNKRTVDLTWTTSSEHNSDYFIAQKTNDLINWDNVAVLSAAGNSTVNLDYACEDINPLLGLNYYRLKQVDIDGSFEYSNTRVVNLESTQDISIYPNPTNSIFSVQVKDVDSKKIKFFNTLGQEVEFSLVASSIDLYQFDTNDLTDGIYYIQVTSGLDSRTYKLIVCKNK